MGRGKEVRGDGGRRLGGEKRVRKEKEEKNKVEKDSCALMHCRQG